MTYEEKKRLAVQRELVELRKISRALDRLVVEFHDGVNRLEKIADDERLVDEKINALDALFGRPTKPLVDMNMNELARHFGGA